ncbi:alpha/beta fold hydrolase [Rubrobacter tropicus]|uniref:Alpha/beta fold hydrolase n=1 Tax=Rubrobacter tropicus TaxID=2653851 RepID=A0A6G8Q4U5_9ACTN|nr:alpha/beta fold hydrolase [Rubrobacter tropicus]QIN81486.1 alpha/beta fold hydrolase [Rubrobacter tropicus]
MIRERSSGGAGPLRLVDGSADGWGLGPLGICNYDGPETIRARKYATGTHVLLREVGVETGATPREVVWSRNKARLYRYRGGGGRAGRRRPVPVLLIYGFVLKPYVLDLVPGNSLVEYLVGEGFDVYMLDFGVSGAGDARLSLEDFVLDYMHGAVRKVVETSGAKEVSLFGQSQGGTLCAMYASLFPEGPIKNLVLLSAPTEFVPRDPGLLGLWTFASRNGGALFDPAVVPRFLGNLPTGFASSLINAAASLQAAAVGTVARAGGFGLYDAVLREVRDLAGRDVSLRSWLAVSKWVDDAAPFPGETFRQWVKDFYQRDMLVKGRVELRGRRVDLSNIRCSVLNASGKWDYVVPASQTGATTILAGSRDKESVSLDAGHVGMLVGPGAADLWPRVGDWLAPRSGR